MFPSAPRPAFVAHIVRTLFFHVPCLLLTGGGDCRCLAHAAQPTVTADTIAEEASVSASPALPIQSPIDEAYYNTAAPRMHTIQLQRQLVPVMKNGRLVANKTAFFGDVYVGTPPQAFTVVMDTGSGHLILPSTACNSDTCRMHSRYNRSSSASAVDIEADGRKLNSTASERDQVAIAFGTGEVLGEFVKESVCLSSSALQCVDMRVVVATSMTPEPFGSFAFDGVLGIGLESLALNSKFSFFGEMSAQYPAMLPYFAVFLARSHDEQSSISFGGFDPALASSGIQWVPADMQHLGYWQVRLRSVRIGDMELDACSDGSCRAILDTGTSLLGVPRATTRALSRLLARPAPTDGDTSCLEIPGPIVTFDVGGVLVNLGADDYSQSAPVHLAAPGKEARPICKSLLMPVDMQASLGPKVFIFGEPVLRRYYTVYDMAQKRIGFMLARHGAMTKTAESITI